MHIHEFCCMLFQAYPHRCMITSHKHYTIYELQVSFVNFSDNLDDSTEHYPCFSVKRRNQKLKNTEIYLFFKVLFKIFTTGLCQRKVCYLIFTHVLQKQLGLFEVWQSLWKLNHICRSRSSVSNKSYASNNSSCLWGAAELLFLFEVHYPTTLLPIKCYICPHLRHCVYW